MRVTIQFGGRNLSNTLLASYAYDGNGMQVIKVVGAWRQWFIYAGAQLVSEYYDAASATYTSPTSPGSAPSDSLSTVLYQHSDHLTTRVTTENDGDLSNQQAHYPYGENWYNNGTANPSVKRKFTSYRKETDGSLASGQINYAIARYHGARIGRFHRPDPVRGRISNPQRLNRYAYVTGNPINRIDPRGTDDVGPCFGGECLMQDTPNWGTPTDLIFANPTWQTFNAAISPAGGEPIHFGPEWIVGPGPGGGHSGGGGLGSGGFGDGFGDGWFLGPNPFADCREEKERCLSNAQDAFRWCVAITIPGWVGVGILTAACLTLTGPAIPLCLEAVGIPEALLFGEITHCIREREERKQACVFRYPC